MSVGRSSVPDKEFMLINMFKSKWPCKRNTTAGIYSGVNLNIKQNNNHNSLKLFIKFIKKIPEFIIPQK